MAKRARSPITAGSDPRLEAAQSLGFTVGVCICLALSLSFLAGTLRKEPGNPPVRPQERVNPNDAPVASLARLPGIGPTRARAIVSLREQLQEQGGCTVVFYRAEDLQQVKGIGPATVKGIRPWLRFDPPPEDADQSSL